MAHIRPQRWPRARIGRPQNPPHGRPQDGPPVPPPWVQEPPPPRWGDAPAPAPHGPAPDVPAERRPRPGWRPGSPGPSRPSRRLLRRLGALLAVVVVVQALIMLSLRWVNPPTTAFMLANPDGVVQQFVPVEHVSRNFLAAVIAHEDQQLPYRAGAFEWDQLIDRAKAHLAGEEDPHGSTIPQQVAKNLFLNQELSSWRKAVEAGLSMELALLIDDRRMLELYVNYAQFGPRIYGVCAASWYYFDQPPQTLYPEQAVQLVGLLPSPGHVRRAPGGGMDFDVDDGLGWLSRSHVLNAQARVPRHLAAQGFRPVEDVGVEGLASDQPPADDDCSQMPDEVAELIAEEGTA